MKFGQLMEYNVRNTFLQKSCRIVADPILFFKKALRKVKAISVLIYFDTARLGHTTKTNLKHFRLLIHRYAQFWFFIKESGTSFSTAFCGGILKKNISLVMSS